MKHVNTAELQPGDKCSLVVENEPCFEVISKTGNTLKVKHLKTGKKEYFTPSTEGLPIDAPDWLKESALKCWKYD